MPFAAPRRSLQLMVVVALACAAFLPALGGGWVSDDAALVQASGGDLWASVTRLFWSGDQTTTGMYRAAYRPVTQLLLHLATVGSGARPLAFHLLNLLLHAANAWLVLRWLERRLAPPGSARTASTHWAALFGATLFAIHPAHAESVAWISGITDLAMTLGLLVGCELLERTSRAARVAAAFGFGAAVCAKEPAALAPLALWVDGWAQGLSARDRLRRALPCIVGCAAAAGLVLTRGLSQAGEPAARPSPLNALALLGLYARAALAPHTLTFQAQPYVPGPHGMQLPRFSIVLGAACVTLALALLLRSLKKPNARPWLADATWFLVLLAPAVLLLPDVVSDRFLYAPLLGLSALGARALQRALRSARPSLRRAAGAAAMLALAAALPMSTRAAKAFTSDESLWRSQHAAYPHLLKPLDALAEDLVKQSRFSEARRVFERGLVQAQQLAHSAWTLHFVAHLASLSARSRPEWDERAQRESARSCVELLDRGHASYAHDEVRVSLPAAPNELAPLLRSPDLVLLPCARAALSAGDAEHALSFARRALDVAPDDLGAREVCTLALARLGRYQEALDTAISAAGQPAEALVPLVQRVRRAQSLAESPRPDDLRQQQLRAAHVALTLGSPVAARRALSELADPTDHEGMHLRAQSYLSEGRFDRARKALQTAARLAPADPFWGAEIEQLDVLEANTR